MGVAPVIIHVFIGCSKKQTMQLLGQPHGLGNPEMVLAEETHHISSSLKLPHPRKVGLSENGLPLKIQWLIVIFSSQVAIWIYLDLFGSIWIYLDLLDLVSPFSEPFRGPQHGPLREFPPGRNELFAATFQDRHSSVGHQVGDINASTAPSGPRMGDWEDQTGTSWGTQPYVQQGYHLAI